jgi:hypothetical protein
MAPLNFVFTLFRINNLVDIGLAPHSPYKYDEQSDDTGREIVDDNGEALEEQEEQPYEEQASVEEQDEAQPSHEEDT